jgi:hypothetical protein
MPGQIPSETEEAKSFFVLMFMTINCFQMEFEFHNSPTDNVYNIFPVNNEGNKKKFF